MFKTALITGGNGNLGRLVAQHLEAIGTKVVSFDLPGSEGAHCEPRHAVVLGDMQDQSLLEDTLTAYKPDVVIHLASMLSGSSQANPSIGLGSECHQFHSPHAPVFRPKYRTFFLRQHQRQPMVLTLPVPLP
jgi:GDP-D-mannose dehydratase